ASRMRNRPKTMTSVPTAMTSHGGSMWLESTPLRCRRRPARETKPRAPIGGRGAGEGAGPAAGGVVAVDADDREHAAERAGQERLVGAEEIVAAEVRLGGRDAGGARELEDAAARDAVEQAVVEGRGPDRVA